MVNDASLRRSCACAQLPPRTPFRIKCLNSERSLKDLSDEGPKILSWVRYNAAIQFTAFVGSCFLD